MGKYFVNNYNVEKLIKICNILYFGYKLFTKYIFKWTLKIIVDELLLLITNIYQGTTTCVKRVTVYKSVILSKWFIDFITAI